MTRARERGRGRARLPAFNLHSSSGIQRQTDVAETAADSVLLLPGIWNGNFDFFEERKVLGQNE